MALRFGKSSDDSPPDPQQPGTTPEPSGGTPTGGTPTGGTPTGGTPTGGTPTGGTPIGDVPPLNLPPGFDPSDFVVQHTSPDDPTLPTEESFNFGDFEQDAPQQNAPFEQDAQNVVSPTPTSPSYEQPAFDQPSFGREPTPSAAPGAEVPLTPPSTFNAPPEAEPDETASVRPRRRVPILPLVLAAFLIIGGGVGALLFMRSQQNSDDLNESTQPRPTLAARPTAAVAPTTPSQTAPPAKSTAPTSAPRATTAPSSSGMIPPPPSTNALVNSLRAADRPTRLKFLKALWRQGANAKHRGDYEGARRAWNNILLISPNHPDICEALMKLPKTSGGKPSGTMRMMKH